MIEIPELLGESSGIRAVRTQLDRLLRHHTDGRRLPPILIQGETGTGKGLLARALHRTGSRAAGPLVEVNCAAIPETLLEAELFGFERGAFTDARQPKAGLFQTAHGGTLFLDEVGLLPERVQAKFLKVLEDGAVRRLGSTQSEPADVAIVAATSEDLVEAELALGHHKEIVGELMARVRPRTVWDLGANTGLFSRLAAAQGARTISFDVDPGCVERNYLECKRTGEERVLPLLLDLTAAGGHVAVVGAPRSGRSTLVTSLAQALCASTTPARTRIAVVDLGGDLATLRALKASKPETQVIMLSGRNQASTIVEAVRLGAADYVVKPDDPEGLGDAALEIAIRSAQA